ncbi:MAG: DUF4038 domain-containing protein, partial [Gemmatimonadales bacterium]|nr:DUF4038 domain-containing protein [Gemmatimonadales bacterium]NIR03628.1 DUF4038 domain-containing protein [Gemmatimonadales bacterium]
PEAFRNLIDLLVDRGFNYIVTNLYAHLGFSEVGHPSVFGPPKHYVFGGTNEQPDHSRLNLEFFRGFDSVMDHLHAKGVVVHLMLSVQNKHVNWPEPQSVEDDLYWRYAVSRYQAYPNLVWDVGKESYYLLRRFGSHEYTLDRIRLIREADAYRHLVTVHDSDEGAKAEESAADAACDFVSDQVHLGDPAAYVREAARRFAAASKPYMNIEYGYEEGVEAIKTYTSDTTSSWQDVLLWTYAVYFGGGYPCYYYSNAAWDLIKFEPEPPGWPRYRYLRDLLRSTDFNALAPRSELVSRGFCLAEPGRQYLIFLPEGGGTEIDLTGAAESADIEC